ncbi:MAG: hypothetical protein JNL82_38280 [Myxococcales bacterium]|nr:hypothetical protein [Myxococcales bacterium]
MRTNDPTHYNIRFDLQIPLVCDTTREPSEVAFDRHLVSLVHEDEAGEEVVARAELYRIHQCGENVVLAADEIGDPYLEGVCLDAVDRDGSPSEELQEAFPGDAISEVHVLTSLEFSGEEDALIRVFFVRAVLRHIGRGFEALFVEDSLERLSLWEKTIKARQFRDYIVAPGGHILPDMLSLLEPSVRH